MNQIETEISQTRDSLKVLSAFNSRHGHIFAEEFSVGVVVNPPNIITFSDSAVPAFGKEFGRDGWERVHESGQKYSWTKEVEGVRLKLYGCETLDFPKEVPPASFPLQLEDSDERYADPGVNC